MTGATDSLAVEMSIQRACDWRDGPDDDAIERVAAVALTGLDDPVVNLRIVDEEEGRALNARWRQKDYATNVLSFPADLPEGAGINLLGDVVICAPVVEREAGTQGKAVADHFAHLLIHGILHLQGHDHISAEDADRMEALEIEQLERLGLGNPYEHHES